MKRKADDDADALVEGLDPAARATLYHLIACPWCSGNTVNHMPGRYGVELFLQQAKPGRGAEASALEEFDLHSWSTWLAWVDAGKKEGTDLFRLALRAGREVQGSDPYRSMGIALEVLKQRARFLDLPEGEDLAFEALTLMTNAVRLLRRRTFPSDFNDKLLVNVSDGVAAGYRRAIGLLLWDRGKSWEAQEQLDLATCLYGASGDLAEEGATLALTGMLHLEKGEASDAFIMLSAGLSGIARGEREWLEARALLAFAIASCRTGRPDLGRTCLRHAESHYGAAMAEDPMLFWGQGKVLAALHETAAAVPFLAWARDSMISQKKLGEAALATLDLSYALAYGGEREQALQELEKLRETFAGKPAARIVKSLSRWWEQSEGTALDARYLKKEKALMAELRQKTGPGLEPLPFV
jgi:tetratricopeptide (TPR) repeat protein